MALASGEEIRADYIGLATGSAYPFPAKSDVDSTAAAHDRVRAAHAALSAAPGVLLLGAGPVGIELAGEIKAVWPDKPVTLLDVADDILGARFRPELKAELRRQLSEAGVELLLASPLREPPLTAPGEARHDDRPLRATARSDRRARRGRPGCRMTESSPIDNTLLPTFISQ